jgi:hypothetical protein
MENFGDYYLKFAHEYVENLQDTFTITKPDGSFWILYNNPDYIDGNWECVICVTPGSNYRIPPDMLQLLKMKEIRKSHAAPIEFNMVTSEVLWNEIFINNYCGIPWNGIIVCSECNKSDVKNNCGKWVRKNFIVCTKCYNKHGIKKRKEYKFMDVTEFNVLDWVNFSLCYNEYYVNEPRAISNTISSFWINCNTDSKNYGKILFSYDSIVNYGANLYMIESVGEFVNYISQWMLISADDNTAESWEECINKPCTETYCIQLLLKYNIVQPGTLITNKIILENADVRVDAFNDICNEIIQGVANFRDLRTFGLTMTSYIPNMSMLVNMSDEELKQWLNNQKHIFSDVQLLDKKYIDLIYYSMFTSYISKNYTASLFPVWLHTQLN